MSTHVAEQILIQDVPTPITEWAFGRGSEDEIRDLGDILAGGWYAVDPDEADRAFPGSRDMEAIVDVVLSVAGSRMGSCEVLGKFLISMGESALSRIDVLEEGASAGALMNFQRFWKRWRKGRRLKGERVGVAEAAASNDVAAVGRLLMKDDTKKMRFNLRKQPKSLLRHPESGTLLDIAVGSGSVEVTKCLLEFHGAKPTRETLKMALSSGDLELIRLMWQRLPGEHENRFDLMEVAADFHREEPLAWLLRDATGLSGKR
jgi:hypothetical protein